MKMERMRIFEQLSQFGWIHPVQSEANFVLCKLDGYPPKLLQNNLRQHGVFARCYSTGKGTGLLEEYIRFSCGRPQDTDLIIRSLSKHYESSDFAKSLNETLDLLDVHMLSKVKVILFDMDGVLADVSRSYREAIIQTAAHYGVKITMDDIDFYKNKGNANNDWVLTQKILHENGHSHIDLKEVTNRFQELYEGGLRDTEALMCSQSFIEMLSKQYTLAVVTGRPRAEAEYFLNLHSIRKFFTTLVCMEDTEHPKPHPAPVHLALDLLKCTQDVPCIFIGDTPDDILAGLRAQRRVIPIGLGVKHAAALFRSGAPRVLSNLHDLEYILSPKQNSGSEGSSDSKRSARVSRKTKETQIEVFVDIDGSGRSDISSGVGFLNHMLEALSKHSRMDISLTCVGDLHIDDHHTVEDCALALGEAILKALGSKAGISRFGSAITPLDESLSRAVIDISGRPHCEVNLELTNPKVGDLSSEMISHFFQSLSVSMKSTIHLDVLRGQNHHHKAEASFKAFALAIRQAVQKTSFQDIPSTKGVL
jgi:imidazoleglycerol-phosphate dehydratase